MVVDLNCDMGESFGAYSMGDDAALMPLVTSANVACGYHAGDPMVMDRTVRLAREHGVGVGAHPGLPDLVGFGRREMGLSREEIQACVLYQVGALAAFVRAHGLELQHVKAHGALYNKAAVDIQVARALAEAVVRFSKGLILVVPAGSRMEEAAVEVGLTVAREAFADRRYNADGTLQSRREAGSVIGDPSEAARQALGIVRDGVVIAHSGERVAVRAETLCVHGDNPSAPAIAREVRAALARAGILVRPMREVVERG